MSAASRRRSRRNGISEYEVRDQARAAGLKWDILGSGYKAADWEAIAVALDSLEAGKKGGEASSLLPDGVRFEGKTITDVPEHEPNLGDFLAGNPDGVFEIKRYWRDEINLDENEAISWSRLEPVEAHARDEIRLHPENYIYVPRHMSYGDYDNSTAVERSNYRVFMEEHGDEKGVYRIYGSHGSEGVGLRLSIENEEIFEIVGALENYPLLSEDDHSQLEQEMQEEAFDSWARRDFVRALEEQHAISITEEGDMAELFWRVLGALGERAGRYPEIEAGGNVYFPLQEMAALVELEDLKKIGAECEDA